MMRQVRILWNAVQRTVLPWVHTGRIKSVRVQELPASVSLRKLYLLGDYQPWAAALVCPCGCREMIHLSLLPHDAPTWQVSHDSNGLPSVVPSIWQTKNCKSHFLLRRGSIVWCTTNYTPRDA